MRCTYLTKHAFISLFVITQVERPEQLREIVPQKRLADKVSGILSRIEAELDAVDEKIGERMHILDLDNDGLVCLWFLPTLMCSSWLGALCLA